MKKEKKFTLLAVFLAFTCFISACGFSDKKETDLTATKESVTENWNDGGEKESRSEGVLESLGEDMKDGAESLGEDIKNGAESLGEDIKNGETASPSEPSK